jgi:solute:Na+ symporter, SSS family
VVVGIVIDLQAKSIAQIWEWLMTALTAGVIVPNVLRWYWWRMNGWGYAAGTLGGMTLSLVPFFVDTPMPMYIVFPPVVIVSFIASIAGTYLTRPVDKETLANFYTTVRPFGLWGPVRAYAPTEDKGSESAPRAILNTVLGMVAVMGLYLGPMYLVGHWHLQAAASFGALLVAIVALSRTWYPYLPPRGEI